MKKYHVASSESILYETTEDALNELVTSLENARENDLPKHLTDKILAKELEINNIEYHLYKEKVSELNNIKEKLESEVAELLAECHG